MLWCLKVTNSNESNPVCIQYEQVCKTKSFGEFLTSYCQSGVRGVHVHVVCDVCDFCNFCDVYDVCVMCVMCVRCVLCVMCVCV